MTGVPGDSIIGFRTLFTVLLVSYKLTLNELLHLAFLCFCCQKEVAPQSSHHHGFYSCSLIYSASFCL
jgi:hypothetical protein